MPANETADDETLLRRYERRGDAAAMETLVRRHAAALGAFLAGWGDAAETEDLVQETWLRVLRRPGAFRGGSFRAWLLRVARNLAVDRSRRRSPALWLDAPADGAGPDAPPLVDALPDDSAPAPDEALLGAEDRARLLVAVRALPGPQRDVFLLRAAGVAFADIAARFRIPLNTALGRMHYAMKALRTALDPNGDHKT